MTHAHGQRILTINSGSSSVKVAVFLMGTKETRTLTARIERIGLRGGHLQIQDGDGHVLVEKHADLPDHTTALMIVLTWLHQQKQCVDAVGHRLVHGGQHYRKPQLITPTMEKALATLKRLDPDHLPHEIEAIKTVRRSYPNLKHKQFACFDTAFHRSMPQVAQMFPLTRNLWRSGIRRFGFHGLSYEFIMNELARVAGAKTANRRVIIAHLGSGASMAAVARRKSLDTTMGFTPTGGLMMSTRSGDLDPGVILYLLEGEGQSPSTVNDLVNRRSGLLGVSGISSDMRDLFAKKADKLHAAEAIALFCYQARKSLGALTAVLGGLDTLIFTAGIGEHMPAIRRRICEGMEFLDIRLDSLRNKHHAPIISRDDSPITVRVMKTDEELMIARHTHHLIRSKRN
jgi:acetate kinase